MNKFFSHYKYVTSIGQIVKKLRPPGSAGPRNEKCSCSP